MGAARVYGAGRVNGRKISLPFLVSDIDDPFRSIEHPVPGVAGRQHAVEHINSPGDAFQNIFGRPDPHEVAGFVFRENFCHQFCHCIHILRRFAYGESAYSVALAPMSSDGFGRDFSQLRIGAALNDWEKSLLVAINRFGVVEAFDATLQPAMCEAERFFGVLEIARVGRTLIEGHNNVGADDALDVHHIFWRENVL